MTLRASVIPLFLRCSQSAAIDGDAMLVDPYNDAAELGTAIHLALRDPEADTPVPDDSIDADDYYRLVGYGRKVWRERLRDFFAEGEVEKRGEITIADQRITGTADRVHVEGDTLFILDWKTGRLDGDWWPQMQTYGLIFGKSIVGLARIVIAVVKLRDLRYEVREFTREQMEMFHQRMRDAIGNARRGVYQPGAHCTHCPRQATCEGRAEWTASAIRLVGGPVELPSDPRELGPFLKDRLEIVKAVESVCKQFRQATRDLLFTHGQLPTVEGKALKLVAQNRREIKPLEAWPVLSQRLTEEELAACVKISVGAVEKAVAAKAPPRGGAAAKRELSQALEVAGAVEINPNWQVQEINVNDDRSNGD